MRLRYGVLSLLLLSLMGARTLAGQWSGDYWEHAAVVRELARAPFAPSHPQLPVDAPHAFFSPYHLALGLAARASGLGPFATLGLAGLANLAALLAALPWLLAALFPRRDAHGLAFYALLATLLLWGPDPWDWSGFLHLGVLGRVLPYPSTAAAAGLLLALGAQLHWLRERRARWLALLVALTAAIVLTHPATAGALAVGLFALCLGRGGTRWGRTLAAPALAFAVALAAAATWPYYPFFELVAAQTPQFHFHSRHLYESVLLRTFPALAGLPLLALRARRDPRDPLAWTFGLLLAVYAAGAWSGRQGLGRVLAWVVFVLHLCAAEGALRLEERARSGDARARRAAVAIILALAALAWAPLRRVAREIAARPSSAAPYAFLEHAVEPGAVVLSDITTSLRVPAFGAKIVATKHPIHFLGDHAARRADVHRFLTPGTPEAARRAILRRYDARWVLLDARELPEAPALWRELTALGTPVHAEGALRLLRVGTGTDAAPDSDDP